MRARSRSRSRWVGSPCPPAAHVLGSTRSRRSPCLTRTRPSGDPTLRRAMPVVTRVTRRRVLLTLVSMVRALPPCLWGHHYRCWDPAPPEMDDRASPDRCIPTSRGRARTRRPAACSASCRSSRRTRRGARISRATSPWARPRLRCSPGLMALPGSSTGRQRSPRWTSPRSLPSCAWAAISRTSLTAMPDRRSRRLILPAARSVRRRSPRR